jgi:hypothetical protein
VSPTCALTICVGQADSGSARASSGAYDGNLAAMMLGGLL